MPSVKLHDYAPLPAPKINPPLTTELEGFVPAHSPARALQQQLARHAMAANGAEVARWSPRRSLAMIVTTSAALWMAILMAGAHAAKMIA